MYPWWMSCKSIQIVRLNNNFGLVFNGSRNSICTYSQNLENDNVNTCILSTTLEVLLKIRNESW